MILPNQQQTLDYQETEPFLEALKRRIAQLVPFMQETPGIIKQDIGKMKGVLTENAQKYGPQVEKIAGKATQGLTVPGRALTAPLSVLADIFGLPNINDAVTEKAGMLPGRLVGAAEMKINPNPQTQTQPQVVPPPPQPQPQPMPEQIQTQPQPPMMPPPMAPPMQQAQAQPGGMPMMPQGNTSPTFQEYWKQMQEMQPTKEKSWIESPMYPLSMMMMGLGQNLSTPPRMRGYNNPMAPLIAATQQQMALKKEGNKQGLFEKAVASYPHYVQATRPEKSNVHFAYDPETKQFTAVPGAITNLPNKQENSKYGITVGPSGASQIIGLPPGEYITMPEAKQKENPPYVVPFATEQGLEFRNVPQGMKPTAPIRQPQPNIFQQMQQNKGGAQGTARMVNVKVNGQIVQMTEEEARRRGFQWGR
jgi:hypothetical protein